MPDPGNDLDASLEIGLKKPCFEVHHAHFLPSLLVVQSICVRVGSRDVKPCGIGDYRIFERRLRRWCEASITSRSMATRFFLRSLFRIALARCVGLDGRSRFLLVSPSLASLSLFEIEPIPSGLFLSTEPSIVRSAVELIGKSRLPSPGRLKTLRATVPIEVMRRPKRSFAPLFQTQTRPNSPGLALRKIVFGSKLELGQ